MILIELSKAFYHLNQRMIDDGRMYYKFKIDTRNKFE